MLHSHIRTTASAASACAALVAPLFFSHTALAQTTEELDAAAQQVCRVSWESALTGDNAGTARGTAEINRRSGDPDVDSYHLGRYMGEGIAEVSLTPPEGCSVVSGSPRSVPYSVFVRSNNGETVDVVHSEDVTSFPVVLQCEAGNLSRRMEFRAPGTLYPDIRDGETLEYDMTDFDGGSSWSWWWRGTMTLGLCGPGERDYPPLSAAWLAEEEPAQAEDASEPDDVCADMTAVANTFDQSSPELAVEFRNAMRQLCPDL